MIFSSEHALEKRGLELIATNQLWAGLVFPDITEGIVCVFLSFSMNAPYSFYRNLKCRLLFKI